MNATIGERLAALSDIPAESTAADVAPQPQRAERAPSRQNNIRAEPESWDAACAERMDVKARLADIDIQLQTRSPAGPTDHEFFIWQRRASAARRAMQGRLSFLNEWIKRHPPKREDKQAPDALPSYRRTLLGKQFSATVYALVALYEAASAMIDEDTDDAWQAFETAFDRAAEFMGPVEQ